MYSETQYGLSLIPDGKGGYVGQKASSGYGGYSAPLGGSFTDAFRKDRVPSPQKLVAEMVGIAWACAALNANLIASLKVHLYCVTRKGQAKHRYVEAFERQRGYSCSDPVNSKTLSYLKGHANGHRGLGRNGMMLSKSPGFSFTGDMMVEEIYEHPILDLLNKPETTDDDLGLSGFDHRWATQLYQEVLARSYWLKESGGGNLKHLWLLHSQYMSEVPDQTGAKFLGYYQYGSGSKQPFTAEEVIKLHIPDIAHLRLGGFSPMMAAYEKLGIMRKGDAQINAILENGGFPGLIATPKPTEAGTYMGAPEARRLQASLNGLLRQGGYGSTLVLPEPLEMTFPHWKPNENLSLERYQQYKEDVCNDFDCPTTVLQRNDSNLASAKTGDYAHAKYAGVPRVARYEGVVNTRVVPEFEKNGRLADRGRLFVALDNVIPDDEIFDLEQRRVFGSLGAATVNEMRSSMGLHDIDGPLGDARYINGNLVGDDGVPIMAVQQGPSPGTINRDVPPNDDSSGKAMVFLATALSECIKAMQETKQPVQVTVTQPDNGTEELAKTVRELGRTLPKIARLLNDSKSHAHLLEPGHGARADTPDTGKSAELDHSPADAGASEPRREPEGGNDCAVHAGAGRLHPRQLDGESVKSAMLQAGYDESEIADKLTSRAIEHVEL